MLDALCHLHFASFDGQRDAVAERAAAVGIDRILTPATGCGSWDGVLQCRRFGPVALGVHPWFAKDQAGLAELEEHVHGEGAAAIGEIGLDAVCAVPMELQLTVFRRQLKVAARLGLPVILHCVRAHHLLMRELLRFGVSGMLHAYSGGPHLVPRYLAMGMHFSFGRALLNERAVRIVLALQAVPPDRRLVESDAPDQLAEPAQASRVVDRLRELDLGGAESTLF